MEEKRETETQKNTEVLKNQDWCNKSLEQLNLSAALLSQCLDSDLNDLNRQNMVLSQCLEEITSIRQNAGLN